MTDDSLDDAQPLKIAQDEMMKASAKYDAEFGVPHAKLFKDNKLAQNDVNYCCTCDGFHEVGSNCPAKTRIVGIAKAFAPSVFETEIWNKAIEAAANVSEINSAANIRKLRK